MKNNNSEADRVKAKFEKQIVNLRDEKAKIQQSLSEARIRNEQIDELKKTIEVDQKEKNELSRQVFLNTFSSIIFKLSFSSQKEMAIQKSFL